MQTITIGRPHLHAYFANAQRTSTAKLMGIINSHAESSRVIIRPRPKLYALFFIIKGSIVLSILPLMLFLAALSSLVVTIYTYQPNWLPKFDGGPFALLGITLSIFLAFRNNACYERWWEARKLWGELILAARNLGRLSLVLDETPQQISAARRTLLGLCANYAQALLVQLRPSVSKQKLEQSLDALAWETFCQSRNPAETVLQAMTRCLHAEFKAKKIDVMQFKMLNQVIQKMAEVQSSCERIQNTPIPFGYTLLLHRTAYTFCFLMPFCFANTLGWATPFVTALAAYTFFGLDALGSELEQPFSDQANALAIQAMADTIGIEMQEMLGETVLPELPQPSAYVLM